MKQQFCAYISRTSQASSPFAMTHVPGDLGAEITRLQAGPAVLSRLRVQDRKLVVQGSFMLFSTAFAREGSKNSRKRRRKLKCGARARARGKVLAVWSVESTCQGADYQVEP